MNFLIVVAAAVMPDVLRAVAVDATGAVAGKVAEAVFNATGATSPDDARKVVDADPHVSRALQGRLADIIVEAHRSGVPSVAKSSADTDGGRSLLLKLLEANVQEAWTPTVLSTLVVVGFIAAIAFVSAVPASGPQGSSFQVLNVCIGALATGFATVLNFWLGSSLGSRRKGAVIQARLFGISLRLPASWERPRAVRRPCLRRLSSIPRLPSWSAAQQIQTCRRCTSEAMRRSWRRHETTRSR